MDWFDDGSPKILADLPGRHSHPAAGDYVLPGPDNSPFAGLLTAEIRYIRRRARLTDEQGRAFEWFCILGLLPGDIAPLLGVCPQAVDKHLRQALAKASALTNIGVFTVLVEAFGYSAVYRALHDIP